MPFGNSEAESQRDSGAKPKVARNELPWGKGTKATNPNGVEAPRRYPAATPLGLKSVRLPTQGSSFLATLGWWTQSLWDCSAAGLAMFRMVLLLRNPDGERTRPRVQCSAPSRNTGGRGQIRSRSERRTPVSGPRGRGPEHARARVLPSVEASAAGAFVMGLAA